MKKILSFAFVLLTFISCKKDKDEFVPTTVNNALGYLSYKEANGDNNSNWYSIKSMDGLSLPAISKDVVYQESIVFGFYNQGDEYGIYSPTTFPKVYGQENWSVRLPVTFRKTNITIEQLDQLRDQHTEGFPPQLIVDNWKKGINERDHITHPKEGETYAFRTKDGKITGLLQIHNVNSFYTSMQFEIWVAR
jgi:hypothetical protein